VYPVENSHRYDRIPEIQVFISLMNYHVSVTGDKNTKGSNKFCYFTIA